MLSLKIGGKLSRYKVETKHPKEEKGKVVGWKTTRTTRRDIYSPHFRQRIKGKLSTI